MLLTGEVQKDVLEDISLDLLVGAVYLGGRECFAVLGLGDDAVINELQVDLIYEREVGEVVFLGLLVVLRDPAAEEVGGSLDEPRLVGALSPEDPVQLSSRTTAYARTLTSWFE